jgi:hypothetical protein
MRHRSIIKEVEEFLRSKSFLVISRFHGIQGAF